MDIKRTRKVAASPSSDTESDPQADMAASSSSPISLGKRAQDDALASEDAKKQRKQKPKAKKDHDVSEVPSVAKNEAEQVTAVLTDAAQPVEMVITNEEAVGLNAAVAASTEQIQEQKTLGLDFTENSSQFMLELLDFDKSESNGADELVKDNEIVVESLAAQGLLRDTQRALALESFKGEDLPVLTASEANSTVSRLLHFMSQENDNLLTLSERRTGRANLLILQRLMLKAREREREREAATDFTV
ncbi:hypothetical protein AM587_10016385 [Phytophthora nicotianae]|uniref:Uncharacterized protein n=1 Tax=Phytophthora nicotianae TaxID=4792 RepID=A0A0W8CGT7_PHYNI|nr:hypothetical protein AM587_10016385 [Phytophthora nicotianae]